MYSEQLLSLFHEATHGGKLPNATNHGIAGTPGLGPSITLWLHVTDSHITEASWKAWGCPAAIGCAEAFCAHVEGMSVELANQIAPQHLIEWVDGIPDEKEHCPRLVVEAGKAALENVAR
jgi:nitrogen fixation protein NifU and related proteins